MFVSVLIGWLLACTKEEALPQDDVSTEVASGFTPVAFGITEWWLHTDPTVPQVTLPNGEKGLILIQIYDAEYAVSMDPMYQCELVGSVASFQVETSMPWAGSGLLKQESGTCEEKGVSLGIDGVHFLVIIKELFDSQRNNLRNAFALTEQSWEDVSPYAMYVGLNIFSDQPAIFQEYTWGIQYESDVSGQLQTDQNGDLIPKTIQGDPQGIIRILGLAPFEMSDFPKGG